MERRRGTAFASLLALSFISSLPLVARGPLTFEERVNAQEAIERVYYEHRIWPKENPQPKPPFEEMVPREVIEAKVTDYLKQCAALDLFWKSPIEQEQLQAEMDRMGAETRDSGVLQELFEALRGDPGLVAECLARPNLADRLLRKQFILDPSFHSDALREVEQIESRIEGSGFQAFEIGSARRWRWIADDAEAPFSSVPGELWTLHVLMRDIERMERESERARAGIVRRETREAWTLSVITSRGDGYLEGLSWTIPKAPFEVWWDKEAAGVPSLTCDLESGPSPYRLPAISSIAGGANRADAWITGALEGEVDPRVLHTAVWTGTEMIIWGGSDGVGSSAIGTGSRYNPATDTWLATGSGANWPGVRLNHSAIWTGTEMVVWGGTDSNYSGFLNTGARYNPVTDTWQPLPTGGGCPSARSGHTAVWTGSSMIVWGGLLASSTYTNTGGIYTPATNAWTTTSVGTDCPTPRNEHTAVWTGSRMIVWGGVQIQPTHGSVNTGGIFDPAGGTWAATPTGGDCPTPRLEHRAVWTGTEMIVWGGCGVVGDISSYLATGARFDPSGGTWAPVSSAGAPSDRAFHTALWTGSKMLVWGGYGNYSADGNDRGDGGLYDPQGDTWSAVASAPGSPVPRHHHAAVWTGTLMIVWGGTFGCPNCGPYMDTYNTGGKYNPTSGSWTPTSTGAGAPQARTGHTAVFTGSEMIVWGGVNYYGPNPDSLKTGGRYNLATGTWTPTPTSGSCPTERYDHTAVWTGTEMVVWGGEYYFQDGGRYNPTTNFWRATSLGPGCPSGRVGHTAIWTGSLMVIWGGMASDGPHAVNDGGQYNPANDTWQATATGTGCPSARGYHSAVWTGGRMIVWGGTAYNHVYFSNGGQYDPSTGAWTTVPSAPAGVVARWHHRAVWTGQVMIVWGGDSEDLFYPEAGALFDPSTGLWAPTDTGASCPHGRIGHAAVWTGDRMLIWGGTWWDNTMFQSNEGSLFDPQSNRWEAMEDAANGPSPRADHSAVWTGSKMLVWGGSPQTATGGIYRMTSAPPCGVQCQAAAAPSTGAPPLTVSFSAAATPSNCSGGPSYAWVFGDGGTSSQQNPTHTYTSPGTFNWTMTASAGGATCSRSGTVTVAQPCVVNCSGSAAPSSGPAPLEVSFSASATTSGCTGGPSFAWSFGDGQISALQNPRHTYAQVGTYSWALTVSAQGTTCTKSGTITVTEPCSLTCAASATPSSGEAPLAVSFAASTTPSNCTGSVSFLWDFGDGATSTQQNPSHTYSAGGNYAWSMTAANQGVSCSKTGAINVNAPCSLACSATAQPSSGFAPLEVTFTSEATASNCSEPPAYAWSFGDGGSSAQQNPTHTYTSAGTYEWTLTVTVDGIPCSRQEVIAVDEPCAVDCAATVPTSGRAGDLVSFLATMELTHCVGNPMFEWDFGDGGTSTEQDPGHAYAAGGSFTWALTVTVDGETCTRTGAIEIREACAVTCAANAAPSTGTAPLAVSFDGLATDTNCDGELTYVWTFGDGATSPERNPSHTYVSPGSYEWTFTVAVEGKNCTQTGSVTVTAPCILTCEAAASTDHGTAPLTLSLSGSATATNCTGEPTYAWSFGDGGTSAEQSPSYTYPAPGTFSWTLTVTVGGSTCTRTGTITVEPGVPGDGNGDGIVSIGEVQQVINMFLGLLPPGNGADCDGDGQISIGEVQKVINAFLGVAFSC